MLERSCRFARARRVRAFALRLGAVLLAPVVCVVFYLAPSGAFEANASSLNGALRHDRKPLDPDVRSVFPDTAVDYAAALSGPPDSVLVLYFHRTFRCEDCLNMESYIKGVLEDDYLDPLLKGSLRWHSFDFEQPEHAGEAEEYGLGGPALVLSHWVGGVEVLWGRMDEIWDFTDYPEAVADTVRAQLRECLAGTCRHEEFGVPEMSNARAPGDTTKGQR
jgi:hypothetical protein